jgi:hypothetical protein
MEGTTMTNRLIAIDPPGCGCTGCIVGDYVPLERAGARDVLRMLQGHLRNHTEQLFWVDIRWISKPTQPPLLRGSVQKVTVYSGADPDREAVYDWDVTDHLTLSLNPLPWF